jgi:hypothetical protein
VRTVACAIHCRLIQLDCHGFSFYDRWLITTFGLPLTAAVFVLGRWFQKCTRIRWATMSADARVDARVKARRSAVGAGFFCTMLFYPKLSATIFQMLRCRKLGLGIGVLEADYNTQCIDNEQYYSYRMAAFVLVLLVPIGVPLLLLALLLHRGLRLRQQFHLRAESLLATDRISVLDGTAQTESGEAESTYEKLYDTFGFCIDDYRARCYWFEPVDLLRKRKSALQICCSLSIVSGLSQESRAYFMSMFLT